MTHFLPTIHSLEKIHPKTKKANRLKYALINALKAEEKTEARTKRKRSTIPNMPKHTKPKGSFIGFIRKSASDYRTKQQEKRLQKARTVKTIRESNLSEEKKQREQAKLGVPIYKEENPSGTF